MQEFDSMLNNFFSDIKLRSIFQPCLQQVNYFLAISKCIAYFDCRNLALKNELNG